MANVSLQDLPAPPQSPSVSDLPAPPPESFGERIKLATGEAVNELTGEAKGVIEPAIGVAETAAHDITGALAGTVGAAGRTVGRSLTQQPIKGEKYKPLPVGQDVKEGATHVQKMLTYQPHTKEGKAMLATQNKALAYLYHFLPTSVQHALQSKDAQRILDTASIIPVGEGTAVEDLVPANVVAKGVKTGAEGLSNAATELAAKHADNAVERGNALELAHNAHVDAQDQGIELTHGQMKAAGTVDPEEALHVKQKENEIARRKGAKKLRAHYAEQQDQLHENLHRWAEQFPEGSPQRVAADRIVKKSTDVDSHTGMGRIRTPSLYKQTYSPETERIFDNPELQQLRDITRVATHVDMNVKPPSHISRGGAAVGAAAGTMAGIHAGHPFLGLELGERAGMLSRIPTMAKNIVTSGTKEAESVLPEGAKTADLRARAQEEIDKPITADSVANRKTKALAPKGPAVHEVDELHLKRINKKFDDLTKRIKAEKDPAKRVKLEQERAKVGARAKKYIPLRQKPSDWESMSADQKAAVQERARELSRKQ